MAQYAMVIDLNKCVGCHSCAVSCKAEWHVPNDFGRSWVKRLGPANTPDGISYTFYPGLCNHCENPVCVAACPVKQVAVRFEDLKNGKSTVMEVGATWKDPFNGVVQVDKERCIGCGSCVKACPYGARYINPAQGDDGKADKCDFCLEHLSKGKEPVCVKNCLAGARVFGDINDLDSNVAGYINKGAESLASRRVNIGPNIYYFGKSKDLYLLKKTCSPQKMPEVSPRRMFLSRGIKKGMKVLG